MVNFSAKKDTKTHRETTSFRLSLTSTTDSFIELFSTPSQFPSGFAEAYLYTSFWNRFLVTKEFHVDIRAGDVVRIRIGRKRSTESSV